MADARDGAHARVVAKERPEIPPWIPVPKDRERSTIATRNLQSLRAVVPIVTGNTARTVFAVSDRSSYLTKAEYSINGGEWMTVYADDGISDGPNERYTIDVALTSPGEYAVTLRVFDSEGNSGNARVVVRR